MLKKLPLVLTSLVISFTKIQAENVNVFVDPQTGLCGFITKINNGENELTVPAQFEKVYKNTEDTVLVPVIKNGTFYRVDHKGVLKFESVFFDNGWDYYQEGLARFLKNGKVGFHNKNGDVVIPAEYDFALPFKNGYSIVCNGCWSYYPRSPRFKPLSSGKEITIKEEFSELTGGKWGVIDIKGKVVVPLQYNTQEEASEKIKNLK